MVIYLSRSCSLRFLSIPRTSRLALRTTSAFVSHLTPLVRLSFDGERLDERLRFTLGHRFSAAVLAELVDVCLQLAVNINTRTHEQVYVHGKLHTPVTVPVLAVNKNAHKLGNRNAFDEVSTHRSSQIATVF